MVYFEAFCGKGDIKTGVVLYINIIWYYISDGMSTVNSSRRVVIKRTSFPVNVSKRLIGLLREGNNTTKTWINVTGVDDIGSVFSTPIGSEIYIRNCNGGMIMSVLYPHEQTDSAKSLEQRHNSVDAFILCNHSKTLNKQYLDVYVPSASVPFDDDCHVEQTLSSIYPKWRSLQSRSLHGPVLNNQDTTTVSLSRMDGTNHSISVPVMRKGGEYTDGGDLSVTVSVDPETRVVRAVLTEKTSGNVLGMASTDSGVYSTLIQKHVDNNYVHGLRSVVGRVRSAQDWEPCVTDHSLPPRKLDFFDLVYIVRDLGLEHHQRAVHDVGERENVNALWDEVGFRVKDATLKETRKHNNMEPGVSVYPISMSAMPKTVLPSNVAKFLKQQRIVQSEMIAMITGAYSVHNLMMRGKMGTPFDHGVGLRGVVDLRDIPSQEIALSLPSDVIAVISRLRKSACPTYFVNWQNTSVGVHIVRMPDGSSYALFQSTLKPLPPKQSAQAYEHWKKHTPMTVFAYYSLTPKRKSKPVVQWNTLTTTPWPGINDDGGISASAMRLSVVDALATYEPYHKHSQQMRRSWLKHELSRYADDENYHEKVSILMQLMSLPSGGVNYWSMAPYFE